MSDLDTQSIIVLSTQHLRPHDAERLDANDIPLGVVRHTCGFFVRTINLKALAKAQLYSLAGAAAFGKQCGFDWVLFDRDAHEEVHLVDDLPTFEW